MSKPSPSTGYNISIIAKHFQKTPAIENYVFEKLSRIEHVADRIIDVIVTLETQKLEHSCSILMNFIHFHIKVHASTDNIYSAIDKATDRITRLIRKYKGRMQSYRAKHLSEVDIHVNVIEPLNDSLKEINDDIEAENAYQEEMRYQLHQIVAKETAKLKTLTQDEAIMKIEFSGDSFLVFRSEEDQKLKVIYRRRDDNYGIMQIQ